MSTITTNMTSIEKCIYEMQNLETEINNRMQNVRNIHDFAQIVELMKDQMVFIKLVHRDLKRKQAKGEDYGRQEKTY